MLRLSEVTSLIKHIFLLEKEVDLVKTEHPNRENTIWMKTMSAQARLCPTEALNPCTRGAGTRLQCLPAAQFPAPQHHGKAGQVSVGQVNLVSSPDCQNNSTFLSGFQHCPSEPGCWELWHRGVEKQLNQTWVSSYRTNASSAFFQRCKRKATVFCFFPSSSGEGAIERKY